MNTEKSYQGVMMQSTRIAVLASMDVSSDKQILIELEKRLTMDIVTMVTVSSNYVIYISDNDVIIANSYLIVNA